MNPQDETALSQPCWEEFDGEYPDLLDGKGFLQSHPYVRPAIPCHAVPMDAEGLWDNLNKFSSGNRKPLLRQLANSPGIHHEPLMAYQGVHPFFAFARQLSKFDVTYCASIPIPAYMSGKPYCYFAVGGDLQWDCGRGDSYGEIMSLAVNAARFLMVSNPHALGHSRRLGFTNGVYLPYPMDSERYCPGQGKYRREWMTRFGGSVYILTTARLDNEVKGFDDHFFKVVVEIARKRPGVRFIFLAWGNRADVFKKGIAETDMERQLIVLMPAGKKRLIEYYRSCDIVLDQLVYGYFGATALEAASVGKPVVMKMRAEQYAPLYGGDVAPVVNLQTLHDFEHVLLSLIDSPERRTELGQAMRNWLVRNHGEETTVPRLLALLRFAAEQMQLPPEIARMNPLLDDETDEEGEYHHSCLREIVHD
jgi:glycosyltransferase involved in cell wall biosynthesis